MIHPGKKSVHFDQCLETLSEAEFKSNIMGIVLQIK
jgi:hypothetical protein